LSKLCAWYLLRAKRGRHARNPVANFHLRNGACLHRVNYLGDSSEKGMRESLGMMVNYSYIQELVEANNQQYMRDGTIAVVRGDDALLEGAVQGSGEEGQGGTSWVGEQCV